MFFSSHTEHIEKVTNESKLEAAQFERISIDELAIRIMERDKTLQLIDVRPVEEFKEFALPNSVNADYTKFLNKEWQKIFNTKGKVNIIYGADETESVKAALAAKDIGYDRLMILEGGLNNFEEKIMNFKMPDEIETKSMKDTYRFRAEASKELPKIIEEAKPKVIETKSERVLGGC
jgi:rhodanese-related sulfurtransferase